MWSPRPCFGGLLVLLSSAAARSSTGDRVLVVLEPQVVQADYSQFWSSLKGRGYDLTFKGPKDETAELSKYGEAQYDHLIMFAPSAKAYATPLTPKFVMDAQISGMNTLYLLNSNMSELNRDTFREYDLEFAERDSVYLDAFSHPPSAPLSTVSLPPASCLIPNGAILSPSTLTGGPIIYPSGTVHTAGMNPYLVEVAHGTKTGYVGEESQLDADEAEVENTVGKKEAVISGRKASLVSALQTRDNVRIGFVGSGAMFSNAWWGVQVEAAAGQTVESGNAGFAEDFTKWIFQETGVVKVVSTHHHREGETEPRETYRIKDNLSYTLSLAQYRTTPNGTASWTSFSAPDIQLDFTMLDPHIRTALVETSSTPRDTSYRASFNAPDRHGVFKFVVEYWRPGWSYIQSSSTASIIPYRHDEYPRFITGAWPFYISTMSISVAFFLFCCLWITLGERDRKGKKKAE